MGIDSAIQSLQWALQGIQNGIAGQTTDLNRIANALERIATVAEERRPTVIWKLDDKDQS